MREYDERFYKAFELVEELEKNEKITAEQADVIQGALRLLVNCLDDYVSAYGPIREECEGDDEEDEEDE